MLIHAESEEKTKSFFFGLLLLLGVLKAHAAIQSETITNPDDDVALSGCMYRNDAIQGKRPSVFFYSWKVRSERLRKETCADVGRTRSKGVR